MKKKQNITVRLRYLMLTCASALVLTSCMPDDAGEDRAADAEHRAAQVAMYAQAFQHYAARSMNAVVNSELWKTQTLPEGVLTLSASAFGSLSTGGAEAYLESAYCLINGEARHLTWFEPATETGDLFLKGLGDDRAGMTAAKLRGVIARENFGIARDGAIEMADGSTVTPSGGCASLAIPHGSTVAVVPLALPAVVAEVQEKYVMRAELCPSGMEGNVLQRVLATYTEGGAILVGANSYGSEGAVMADDGLAWEVVSSNCLTPQEAVARNVSDVSVDALDVANLITIPGEIAATLNANLTDKECKDVHDGGEPEEGADPEESKLYDTCAGPVGIDPLTGIEIDEDRLVKTEEEIIPAQCGGQPAGSGSVTIAPGSANYRGVHTGLAGKRGTLSYSAWSGDVAYKKITRFYEIVEDYGTGRGGATPDGNCANGGCTEIVTYEGMDLQCDRSETLTIPCEAMFPEVAGIKVGQSDDLPYGLRPEHVFAMGESNESVVNWWYNFDSIREQSIVQTQNKPLSYTRERFVTGWFNPVTLIPNQPDDRLWTEGTMHCAWEHERTRFEKCPPLPVKKYDKDGNEIGTVLRAAGGGRYITEKRNFDATSPVKGEWSHWVSQDKSSWNCQVGPDIPSNSCSSSRQVTFEGVEYTVNNISDPANDCSCLLSGSKVVMADGSVRTVESLRTGDVTAAGRVMAVYARSYDDAHAHGAGRFAFGGGLYAINGITVTGNHVVRTSGGAWMEVQHAPETVKTAGPDVRTVYNFLMEHHVIPVAGIDGKPLYFADDLNSGMLAERGMMRLSVLQGTSRSDNLAA